MRSPHTSEALILFHGIALIATIIVTKELNCSRTYIAWRLVQYTVQKTTLECVTFVKAPKLRPLSEKASPYVLFNHTRFVFKILSTEIDGFGPRSQDDDFSEASTPASNTGEVVVEVWDILAPVDEALRYGSYLYLKQVNKAVMNKTPYINLINWEKLVM